MDLWQGFAGAVLGGVVVGGFNLWQQNRQHRHALDLQKAQWDREDGVREKEWQNARGERIAEWDNARVDQQGEWDRRREDLLEQQEEDRRQRIEDRRRGQLLELQRQVYTLSEEAATAATMRNRPELRQTPIVDIDAPWLRRWNEARKDVLTLTELIDDEAITRQVHEFVNIQEAVAHRWLEPIQGEDRVISVDEQLRHLILSLEEPLGRTTELIAQRYRDLDSPQSARVGR